MKKKVYFNKITQLVGITLFLCMGIVTTQAFAASPTIGTISPSGGSSAPNITKTFTCKYSDADGWANIKEAYLLINTTSTAFTNACYLYYDQNSNLLYIRNDTDTAWLGGYAPASNNTIENSYVKVNCLSSIVSGSTTTLTVNWNITFKPAYSGKTYYSYLKVVDDTGGCANWTNKGSYTVNINALVKSVEPSSGTGTPNTPVTFTATYVDDDGWQNIQDAYFFIDINQGGVACPYLRYDQNTDKLYLKDSASWTWLGGYSPGSPNIIENSYAKLDCSATQVTGSGSTLTILWRLITKPAFTGTKTIFLYVRDDACTLFSSGFFHRGPWKIPNQPPSTCTIAPSQGTSGFDQKINFTTTFSDPDTWQNINDAYFLITTGSYSNRSNCFYGRYSQVSNKLYLRNDTDTGWLGGYSPASTKTIENSYVKLDCGSTTVQGDSTTLTINWSITFKPAFGGSKNMYLYVEDNAPAASSWIQKGTWAITDITPPTGTILINSNDPYTFSTSVTLSLAAEDNSGAGGVSQMQFSNDNVNWSAPEAYATTKSWILTEGVGEKTVYVKFKDTAGNWSSAFSDMIRLDTITETSITYVYDDLNRIKNITHNAINTTYTYDEVGNIKNKTTK